jgi:branched-chain amino acid transport system substrate-binding protein
MRGNKALYWLGVLILGAVATAGLAAAEDNIRVGVLGLRAGSLPAVGRAYEEGIVVALQVINEEQGGVLGKKLEVVFEDSGVLPERAAAAVEKLISRDGVVITVGDSHSSSALAAAATAESYRHPLIIAEAPADDLTSGGYRYVFRAGPCNSAVLEDGILSFVRDYGFKRVAIVAENTDFGQGAGKLAEEGLKPMDIAILSVTTERGATEFHGVVEPLRDFSPDLIVTFIYGFELHRFIAQAHAAGLIPAKALLLDGAGQPSQWPQFEHNVGAAGDGGLFVTRPDLKTDFNETSKAFREAYQGKFNRLPSDFRTRAVFDVLLVAADALRRAGGVDCDQLVAALEGTDLEVAGGTVRFGLEPGSYRYHHWQPVVVIAQWQNQQPVAVFPATVASGALQYGGLPAVATTPTLSSGE